MLAMASPPLMTAGYAALNSPTAVMILMMINRAVVMVLSIVLSPAPNPGPGVLYPSDQLQDQPLRAIARFFRRVGFVSRRIDRQKLQKRLLDRGRNTALLFVDLNQVAGTRRADLLD